MLLTVFVVLNLLLFLLDHVFYIVFAFCMTSYSIFIFGPNPSDMLIYFANGIFVGSMGAW